MTPEDTIKSKVIIFFFNKPELSYRKARQFMHTHKMTQCNNFQLKIGNRTDFRQQFTRQFYKCLVMWNVNRFQREMLGLSVAPSGMCPGCSRRCLYLVMLTTLKKNNSVGFF